MESLVGYNSNTCMLKAIELAFMCRQSKSCLTEVKHDFILHYLAHGDKKLVVFKCAASGS